MASTAKTISGILVHLDAELEHAAEAIEDAWLTGYVSALRDNGETLKDAIERAMQWKETLQIATTCD